MLALSRIPFDPENWDSLLERFPHRNIFQTSAWLRFLESTQRAKPVIAQLESGNRLAGYFVGAIVQKFGVKILGSPFPGWTTAYMGFHLRPGVSRGQAFQALEQFAFQELRCVHLEVLDRAATLKDVEGLGYQHRMLKGYEVDVTLSEEQLYAKMSKSCRRSIRKASERGVTVEQATDEAFAEEYFAQLKAVFRRQSLSTPYSLDHVRTLIRHLLPKGLLLLLRARSPEGKCIATGIFARYHRMMYAWGGASVRQELHSRPNEILEWYAIRYWKRQGGSRYDLGGGGEYKRKFGGKAIAIPWVRKSKYSHLAKARAMGQRVVYARRRMLGRLPFP